MPRKQDPPEMSDFELRRDIELRRKDLLAFLGIFVFCIFLLLLPNLLYG